MLVPPLHNLIAGREITVSLTTTSRRIAHVHEVIRTLLNQTITPTRVVLWLSSEPHLLDAGVRSSDVPQELYDLVDGHFLIQWTQNTGPYRKLLPSLAHFSGTIVTADDDTLYPSTWLAGLLNMSADAPDTICCYRAHRIAVNAGGEIANYLRWRRWQGSRPSYDCFPTGKDGVLYPPDSLDDQVFDMEKYLSLAPTADDIWFKAMALKRGTPAYAVPDHHTFPVVSMAQHTDGLFARYNWADNTNTFAKVFAAVGVSLQSAESQDAILSPTHSGAMRANSNGYATSKANAEIVAL